MAVPRLRTASRHSPGGTSPYSSKAGLCLAPAEPLAARHTGCDGGLYALVAHALKLCAPMFLLCRVNTCGPSFLTALGRGLASIAIASLRPLVFGSLAIMLLPEQPGLDGVWPARRAAELAAILAAVFLLARERRRHGHA